MGVAAALSNQGRRPAHALASAWAHDTGGMYHGIQIIYYDYDIIDYSSSGSRSPLLDFHKTEIVWCSSELGNKCAISLNICR